MRIDALIAERKRTLSFEFFPPKTERSWHTLEDAIEQLVPLGPDFVSVTYGAGGGTRTRTREIVEHIQSRTGVTAMAHLTCVNATRGDLLHLLDEYAACGITNLLALRGDPPKGEERFVPTDGGCTHASDLIELIRQDGRFAIVCAAFPEGHPDAASREDDWGHLARKFEAGACLAITQCFFAIEPYLRMMDWLRNRIGERARVVPGILPVVDFHALERFCLRCQASIPEILRHKLAPLADDPIRVRRAGIAYSIEFCRQLLDAGAPGLHLYCLNRSTAAAEIVTSLRTSDPTML